MKRRDAAMTWLALVGCLTVLGLGAAMWIMQPPAVAPGTGGGSGVMTMPSASEADRGVCALIGRDQGLDPTIARAAARSGNVTYTLAALVLQYADEPTPGARQQVLRECVRMGARG